VPPEQLPWWWQSESEPQWPHLPLEQLPWPLQSESEPQCPQVPLEQVPYEQSESEPQANAAPANPNSATAITVIPSASLRDMFAPRLVE